MASFIELKNKFETTVILCDTGASIYDIKTLDKDNKLESILYTTKDKEAFLTEPNYLGKTIGRTGGRISNSKFVLNDKEYEIISPDPNGLHGGKDGVSYKTFDYIQKETEEYSEVRFSYLSKNLESGYPGNLYLDVIYKLYKNINKLTVEYISKSDQDTLLNISNHSYFNLSGNAKSDITKHSLFIDSDYMERIEKLIPQEIVKESTIYSFKDNHEIGKYLFDKEIIENTNGYDYPYILNDNKDCPIILSDNESKRCMKVKTSYPVVVVYTCNYVSKDIMNNNDVMMPYFAVCLECMYHPNTINSSFLKDKKDVLKKDEVYHEKIEYEFEVMK